LTIALATAGKFAFSQMDSLTSPSAIISAARMMQAGENPTSSRILGSYLDQMCLESRSTGQGTGLRTYGKHLLVTGQVGPVEGRCRISPEYYTVVRRSTGLLGPAGNLVGTRMT
jgi:hypothetical protein